MYGLVQIQLYCQQLILGENSVIGAGSIVTKNVDKNIVIAGNPAKFIKKVDI